MQRWCAFDIYHVHHRCLRAQTAFGNRLERLAEEYGYCVEWEAIVTQQDGETIEACVRQWNAEQEALGVPRAAERAAAEIAMRKAVIAELASAGFSPMQYGF